MGKIPASYVMKAILAGSVGSGKTSFIHSSLADSERRSTLGFDLRKIECFYNDSDYCKIMFWELHGNMRFRNFLHMYIKGAKFALLCFEVYNYNSFADLHYWIELIRSNGGENTPIYLIATKSDLPHHVDKEEITLLIKKYSLAGIYYSSIQGEDIRPRIFKDAFSKLELISEGESVTIHLSDDQHEGLTQFASMFSRCPICNRPNHFDYLKGFYFSCSSESVRLKKQLLELMEESKDFDQLYVNKIKIGIPCCDCFKEVFGKA